MIAPLENSCVAFYKMNDNAASKTVIDSQGYSNGTAQQNTEDLTTTGKVGSALAFNGVDDYIDTENIFQSTFRGSFTINLWVKPNDGQSGNPQNILGMYQSTTSGSFLCAITAGGYLDMYYKVGFNNITANSDIVAFSDGVQPWTMITMVVHKTSDIRGYIVSYVNGIIEKSGNSAIIVFQDFTSVLNLFLGANNNEGAPGAEYFAGKMDNGAIYNRSTNSEEVAVLNNSGRGTENFQLTQQLSMAGESFAMAA